MKFKSEEWEVWWKHQEEQCKGEDVESEYARHILDYAQQWVELIEKWIVEELGYLPEPGAVVPIRTALEKFGDNARDESDTEGITGNAAAWAANVISVSWIYGDQFKVWWNTKFGMPDADGIANPAIITIHGSAPNEEVEP